ncbi:MAG: hydroxyacid dehydrogenase [Rhizobium sp.]|uniref:hydroxyacid dehydrogenase n=1 Tax=Rhizobium sp. TaxID=391 RepID=UPI0030F3674D
MPHILVAGKLHPSGVTLLKNATGVTFDYVEEVSEQSYRPFIGKADALVLRTQPLSAPTVAEATSLKVVSRHGVGYDAVDLPSLNERGIALTIVGDINSVSVAEHAMMLILSASKRVLRGDRAVRSPAEWGWRNRLEAEEISGKRLLIIGFGRIGRHLSRMAAGFGMEIKAYDPYLQAQGWPEGHVSPADDLLKGLQWADVISVNIPKADRPIIGEAELAAMKPGSILVNTARGGVVDEKALVGALKSGRVGAAGLDVFDDEPPAASNELLEFDQVVLSPHIAGLTRECGERMAVASVQNVLDYFAGQIDPKLVVNAGELPRS